MPTSYCSVLSLFPAALIIASQRSSSSSTMPFGYCFEGSRGLRGSAYFSGNSLAIKYMSRENEAQQQGNGGVGHTYVELCIHQSRFCGLEIFARSSCTGVAACRCLGLLMALGLRQTDSPTGHHAPRLSKMVDLEVIVMLVLGIAQARSKLGYLCEVFEKACISDRKLQRCAEFTLCLFSFMKQRSSFHQLPHHDKPPRMKVDTDLGRR